MSFFGGFSFGSLRKTFETYFESGKNYGLFGYISARHIGWWVITTGIMTLLPLVLEIKREAICEEIEQLQVRAAIDEGRTPIELANSGVTSALDPKIGQRLCAAKCNCTV